MKIDRRRALSLLALAGAVPARMAYAAPQEPGTGAYDFVHGVASGDPLADRVVLWTRVSPRTKTNARFPVDWEIAASADFANVVAHGQAITGPERDFTVKADATGLKPNQDYFYRFRAGDAVSPIGRTRTLPQGKLDKAVLAFVSCALYPGGFFNAYDHIAKLERVDAVVELGDYYYEYGAAPDDYGMNVGSKLNRIPEPTHDAVTLDDYRMRHAQYKRDADLQAAHARAPWICVWDDHETANDSWTGGAENHKSATEGPWLTREAAALQAYYEWMPIREPLPGHSFLAINRTFEFGDLASLIMVESRLVARSEQISYDKPGDVPMMVYETSADGTRKPVTDAKVIGEVFAAAKAGKAAPAPYMLGPDVAALNRLLNNPERQMMGTRQEEWLGLELAKSVKKGVSWQVLGNQVVMARTKGPNIAKELGPDGVAKLLASAPDALRPRYQAFIDLMSFDVPFDLDSWDGYPAARERVYDAMKDAKANVVVLSGDSHAFWVNELKDAKGARVAAEFGTSSVTSPSLGDYAPGLDAGKMIAERSPEVLLNDQNNKGYTLITITRDKLVSEQVGVDILAKPYTAKTLDRFEVTPKKGGGIAAITKV
jgi:alkaline phosphatase D